MALPQVLDLMNRCHHSLSRVFRTRLRTLPLSRCALGKTSLLKESALWKREGVLTAYGAGQGDLYIELLEKDREAFRPGRQPNT